MLDQQQILQSCTVQGNIVKLPPIQLDRHLYQEVAKALQLIGGKWKGGKTAGFVFDDDPTTLLAQIANGEQRNLKKEYQFFETPPDIADWLIQLAKPERGNRILEPSAGAGAILRALHRSTPDGFSVDCCETMPVNRSRLEQIPGAQLIADNFLQLEAPGHYHRIIANPPFSKNQDIDHIRHMYECLSPGGRLVTVASRHWQTAQNNKETLFRQWLDQVNATIHDIPAGAFKSSGTMVASVVIVIDKPASNKQTKPECLPANAGKATMKITTNLLKTFESFLKGKGSLPIANEMNVANGFAHITDLYTEVIFPTTLTDGLYQVRMGEAFPSSNFKPEDFPSLQNDMDNYVPLSTATIRPATILEYLPFVAKDELRPTMESILFTADATVSSDAHFLRYGKPEQIANPDIEIMLTPSKPLLSLCKLREAKGHNFECTIYRKIPGYDESPRLITMQMGPVTLIQRLIEGTYPRWKSVIPSWKNIHLAAWQLSADTVMQMAKTSKTFKTPLTRLRSNPSAIIANTDEGLAKEFTLTATDTPSREPDGLLMPMIIQDSDEAIIGFNSTKLAQFITGNANIIIGNQFTIDKETGRRIHDSSRAMAVWIEPTDKAPAHTSLSPSVTKSPAPVPLPSPAPAPVPAVASSPSRQVASSPKLVPEPSRRALPEPSRRAVPVPAEGSPSSSPLRGAGGASLRLVPYSDRAVALIGDTRPLTNQLKELWGRFNPNLRIDGQTGVKGWIFSKKREPQLRQLIAC